MMRGREVVDESEYQKDKEKDDVNVVVVDTIMNQWEDEGT
jgi:hypothetical protein